MTDSVNLGARPFSSIINKIGDLMRELPADVRHLYKEIHRKIVIDQIQVEEQLALQQQKIKMLKMMTKIKKLPFPIQKAFLSPGEGLAELNSAIILMLVRELARKSSNSR